MTRSPGSLVESLVESLVDLQLLSILSTPVSAATPSKSEHSMSIDVIGQPAWPDVVLIRLG